MIHVDALDFSEWHSEEVISFFWRSVYTDQRSNLYYYNFLLDSQFIFDSTVEPRYNEVGYNKILL